MATADIHTSVIIVGGSLVGLSAAVFFAHRKVPVVLLERHPTSSPHPRALGYTTRTIEFLRSIGVDSRIPRAQSFTGPPRRISVKSLAGKWQEQELTWTKQAPTRANAGGPKARGEGGAEGDPGGQGDMKLLSPVEGTATAQDTIEPVLREVATELGADLRLGWTVTTWRQNGDAVTTTAVNANGEILTVSASYLIACDGTGSAIREQLGIPRHGVGHLKSLRSVLFQCPALDEYFQRGYTQFQIEGRADGFEAFMVTYGDGRLALMWNEDGEAPMDEAEQKDWVRKAAGKDVADDAITLLATGKWEMGGYIAEVFSRGRVFLAGDAAHTLPPSRGGYGANTGIADAYDLAWKLAAVLSGASRPELLQTYDQERRPVAQVRHDQLFQRDDHARFVKERQWTPQRAEILDDVAMELGQTYRSDGIVGGRSDLPDARQPEDWKGQPGIRAPHLRLQRKKDGASLSSLDLFGKSWVVLSEDERWKECVSEAAEATGVECEMVRIGEDVEEEKRGSFETLFGVGADGAVLVRPDGHIAWRVENMPTDPPSSFKKVLAQVSFAAKGHAETT